MNIVWFLMKDTKTIVDRSGLHNDHPHGRMDKQLVLLKWICRKGYQVMKSPKKAGITGRLRGGEPTVF